MAESPPAYHSVYDSIPFDEHPEECSCIYHQVDGDALLSQANNAGRDDWGESNRGELIAGFLPQSRLLSKSPPLLRFSYG